MSEPRFIATGDKPDLLRIDQLWAFIAQDDEGNEGLCAFNAGASGWMPMVAADEKRVESLRIMAENIVRETGQRVVLCKFATREQLETFG